MSLNVIKQAIADRKMICPSCKAPILQFDKYVETCESIWDGAGDSNVQMGGSKVTLICGNASCDWRERTEYWKNYIAD
ncbi:MAG TPA: hypothetical protein V6D17_23670 [Candidatus Obscuribacterales bacterium]